MSADETARIAASVRARLLNLSRERREDYNLILTRYVLERFLYRLSRSPHRTELVLKGAMLFQVWNPPPRRGTRDLDLLAIGQASPEEIGRKITNICTTRVDENDGLVFDLTRLSLDDIREDDRYGGVRARFHARLGSAQLPVQIDFGIGDAVTPAASETNYPSLLGMDQPVVLAYPRVTVVAEKLEAIVDLGMANSRMKDYFDLWFIATTFEDDPEFLTVAVQRTFARRGQTVPQGVPVGLSNEFGRNPAKQIQWRAFTERVAGASPSLQEVVQTLRDFAMPVFSAASGGPTQK